jgi:hypothetical protein
MMRLFMDFIHKTRTTNFHYFRYQEHLHYQIYEPSILSRKSRNVRESLMVKNRRVISQSVVHNLLQLFIPGLWDQNGVGSRDIAKLRPN